MGFSTSEHNKSAYDVCVLFVLMLCCFTTNIKASSEYDEQEEDRVVKLPGQPSSPVITQFSGYITVNQDHGRALFYWFFEAQSQPSDKPLLLWLNGGPGCSSIVYGAAVELGPLKVNQDGLGLDFNPHAWNKEANLLFIESPFGVGFSYTNTSSDLDKLDDTFVAEDTHNFLVNWLKRFPQYKTHDFYVSGESYAGHFVPQLAEVIYERNKDASKNLHINLKGFMVGNPETDDMYDYRGILEYAWSHSVIPDSDYEFAKKECDFTLVDWSEDCETAMAALFEKYKEIDIYNIYAPFCFLNVSSSANSLFKKEKLSNGLAKRTRIRAGYDPCYSSHSEEYFSRLDVQNALHANRVTKYKGCSYEVLHNYIFSVFSVLPIYKKLINAGLKIWIYSDDCDARVPVIGSRYCVEALGLPLKSPWRSWFHSHQVGGRIVEYEGITMVTVRGAGHLVPLDKPAQAFSMLHSFLFDFPLPANR